MEIVSETRQVLPDFVALKHRFDAMDSGLKAEIRRVSGFNSLADLPAYYRWLLGHRSEPGLQRVAFLLPYVGHKVGTPTLGQQLRKKGVSEMRLFQVVRSNAPRDLEQLRRLVMQVEPQLDWNEFGKSLYFWGKSAKQRILEQYFTPIKQAQ